VGATLAALTDAAHVFYAAFQTAQGAAADFIEGEAERRSPDRMAGISSARLGGPERIMIRLGRAVVSQPGFGNERST
jgi:hypothetical protein